MGKINIPRRFEKKLRPGSFVYTLAKNVEGILDLPMRYFQEYTLHDEHHINAVLKLADALVRNDTLEELNETAVEILVSAVIVHDLGMFIQREGVQSLLFGAYSTMKTERLDTLSWREQWEDFYRKARRYSRQQLTDLFGDDPPGIKLPPDRVDDGGESWRVYGEFLRRFHPRLAHDIVLHGFFGAEVNDIFAGCAGERMDYIKDLIGLVARSHGMELRDTCKYLEGHRLTRRENTHLPMKVPIYYLMAVLRMADYLHAGTDRAAAAKLKAQGIASPVSKNEFRWNQAVYEDMVFFIGEEDRRPDEGSFGEYRGCVEITADPDASATFLSLEKWLHSIQRELDVCWAVLSEKYGDRYKLSIHRVVTNIFDEDSLAEYNKRFLTKRAAVTANPEIAKLLVAPLYGDDPTFAVRELIQNAVDACHERSEWERRHGRAVTPGRVRIEADTEEGTFQITDNGIGMDAEVLLNYFLVAGASFRNSAAWSERNKDDDNKTVTMRSGRFGIGALATFLLGGSATVTTRHIADEDGLGYRFTYDIQTSKPLDVVRVRGVEVGTQITVPLSRHVASFFNMEPSSYFAAWYNWYYFKEPEILITINRADHIGSKTVKAQFFVPNAERDASGWFYCASKEYTSIHWSYRNLSEDMPALLCNGIMVSGAKAGSQYIWAFDWAVRESNMGIYIGLPAMSIIDKEGNLGLDISRRGVTYFKIENEFGEELCRWVLAKVLMAEEIDNYLSYDIGPYSFVFANGKQMFTVAGRTFLFHAKRDVLMVRSGEIWRPPGADMQKDVADAVVVFERQVHMEFDRQIIWDGRSISPSCQELWVRGIDECPQYWPEEVRSEKLPLGEGLKLLKLNAKEYYWGGPDVFCPREPPVPLSDEWPIAVRFKPTLPVPEEKNLMLKVLREYIPFEVNQGLIPVDMEERRRMYPKAFKELAKYMKIS